MTKILILAAANFRDEELFYPLYRMKEEGFDVIVGGVNNETSCKGKFGLPIAIDKQVKDCSADDFDAVIIPGGWAPDILRQYEEVNSFVKDMHDGGKVVAAICHAGSCLVSAGILKGKKATSFKSIKDDLTAAGAEYKDEEVVVDGKLITSRIPADLPVFCKAIIKELS